jgi:hypothetical protein
MTLDSSDLLNVTDPIGWINERIDAEGVKSLSEIQTFLSSLQLSLTLITQECADSDDILASQYLAQMTDMGSEVEKMLDEVLTAEAKLDAVLKSSESDRGSEALFSRIEVLTSALDKVEIAKSALQRGRRVGLR